MNRKKRVPNFGKQKKAFDQVMEAYRSANTPFLGICCYDIDSHAVSIHDIVKPTPPEFRCDVELVIESVVVPKYHPWFWAAYAWWDSPDEIEREMFAQRMLGDRRHSWEQRLGARFIKLGLYPMKTYFNHKRA